MYVNKYTLAGEFIWRRPFMHLHPVSGPENLERGAKKHEIQAAVLGGHLFYD